MKEHKVVEDYGEWIPPDQRVCRFGGGPVPPRKPETRRPLLWLANWADELFLVNASGEMLDSVETDTGGFATYDEIVATVTESEGYRYTNVNPGAAVKVEEFDGFYDLDYTFQVHLTIRSPKLGHIEVRSPTGKGSIKETVLLWETGEPGKHVWINEIS